MKILADENVDRQIVERLRKDGHVVTYVIEEPQTRGATDIPILQRARHENILLVTGDLDFGGYIYRDHEPAPNAGVAQYRLAPAMAPERKAEIVCAVFRVHDARFFLHQFTTIEDGVIRQRPLPPHPLDIP